MLCCAVEVIMPASHHMNATQAEFASHEASKAAGSDVDPTREPNTWMLSVPPSTAWVTLYPCRH